MAENVVKALIEIFNSDDDSDELKEIIETSRRKRNQRLQDDWEEFDLSGEVRKIPKVADYFETIQQYQPDIFQNHFRLNREAMREFIEVLKPKYARIVQNQHSGREGIDLEKRFLITLWTLGNMDPFRSIADRFGTSQSSAHTIFMETCQLIANEERNFIKWPSNYGIEAAKFRSLRAQPFPGVIGAVDGMDISIPAPIEDKPSYYNRKGGFSLKMQRICDSSRKFSNVFVGFPGACHDAKMWKDSPIYQELKKDKNLGEEFHLLGDSAYPLDTFLMKPYRDNGHLTKKQKKFNRILSSHRVIVEHAFGQLKGQYRRLKNLNMLKIESMPKVVMACCVLHNFALEQGVEYTETVIEEEINDTNENLQDEGGSAARNKRDNICNLFE